MSFEDTITRSIEDHVDRVDLPTVDVQSVRRSGQRRRAATTAVASLGVLAVVAGGFALATGGDGPSSGTRIQPAGLPAMDFDDGARAYYDDIKGQLHLGGKVFPLDRVPYLDTSSSATPHGVVYVVDGEVRLLTEDGAVDVLAPAPVDAVQVYSTVKFDAEQPLAAWLTGTGDGTLLAVHDFRKGDVATTRVPCEGDGCQQLALAGIDQDRVFVRRLDRPETLVFDLRAGGDPVAIAGFTVADVRNRVVLGDGTLPTGDPLGKGWRFVEAEGPESLLTFDGGHELYWSSTLRSTHGGAPLVLDVPAKGAEFVNLDSDGSILVAVASGGAPQRYFDCEVPSGACTPIGTLDRTSGDPIFLGNDM